MTLTPRLEQRQSQTLAMTPQLQQAIKLLQLSNLELSEFVEKELESNPMLEREDTEYAQEHNLDPNSTIDSDKEKLESLEPLADINLNTLDSENNIKERELDAEGDNTYTNDSEQEFPGNSFDAIPNQQIKSNSKTDFSNISANLEHTLSKDISLREHLLEQIGLNFSNPQERLIGAYLINTIDNTGYFLEDVDTVATTLGCDLSLINLVLKKLQQFDPSGVFAKNLRECLTIQLKDIDRFDPSMEILMDNLPLLANKKFKELAKVCCVDINQINEMISEIKCLNPKPGSLFDTHFSQLKVPDVLISKKSEDWLIELNPETLPRVIVNNNYYAQVNSLAQTKEDKMFISQQFQSANWLVKSLHQRATTTLKVVTEIVRQQNDFFIKGVQYLKPLVLRDIAEAIEMHESTVSRVTSNKYVATPRGIFELKYFFTSTIGSTSGSNVYSAESIRYRIKGLIDSETIKTILSDDKIVSILKLEGIEIARRTVAKYRESLKIPSSIERRKEKSTGT